MSTEAKCPQPQESSQEDAPPRIPVPCQACRERFVAHGWKICCGHGLCIGDLQLIGVLFETM